MGRSRRTATAIGFAFVASLALVLGVARDARANGRYPAANDVVIGPGAASDMLVVRATFGLLTSEDRGLSWHWICEDALDRAGTWDAAVVLTADGDLVLGVPGGMRRTSGRCDVSTPSGTPACLIPDLAADPPGENVAAAIGCTSGPNGIATSSDRGKSFTIGALIGSMFVETVEVAASDPKRFYLSGYVGGVARLMRSDDGGATLVEVTRDFLGGNSAFISAVDRADEDVVYVRSDIGTGTMLLKSIDGGAHFTKIGETTAKMIGFALSDDGRTVWMGSADRTEGILRSVDGAPFARVAADVTVKCMRYHAGRLYVCGDDLVDGFALACSHDGGDHFKPMFSLRNLLGPEECPSSSVVTEVCTPLWPAQEAALQPPDAGPAPPPAPCDDVVDSGSDTGVDGAGADTGAPDATMEDTASSALDSASVDTSIRPSAYAAVDVGGSGCAMGGAPSVDDRFVVAFVVAAAAILRRRGGAVKS